MRVGIFVSVSSRPQAEEEKISLPFQESSGRAWAQSHGGKVSAILRVPGFSRSDSDIMAMFEEYARQGITAYLDLRRFWYEGGIDVLWAYSFDRLGRSSTLINYVVENTIRAGMQIYLEEDGGFMTTEDFRYKMAIGSIMVVNPMEQFRKKTLEAKYESAKKGLFINGRLVGSHRAVKDERGDLIAIELNEDKTRLLKDAAEVLLAGVAWRDIEQVLFVDYGHARNGKPYPVEWYYHLIHKPYFWGHSAWHFSGHSKSDGQRMSAWSYDEAVLPPPGTEVFRNKFAAVYTGDLAVQVIAELRRRRDTIHGKTRSTSIHRFTGLVMCDRCGYQMGYKHNQKGGWRYYQCTSKHSSRDKTGCTGYPSIREKAVFEYVDVLLRQMLATDVFALPGVRQEDYENQLQQIASERTAVENEIKRLIQKQAVAPDNLSGLYDDEIAARSTQLRNLAGRYSEVQIARARTENTARKSAVRYLKETTLEDFWQKPALKINQILHQIFGDYHMVIRDKQIIHLEVQRRRNGVPRSDKK